MNAANLNETENLIRYSRRTLWTVLAFLLLFGAAAAAAIGFPQSRAGAVFGHLAAQIPIFVVIAGFALKAAAKGARTDPSGPAIQAMRNDELRVDSLNRSFRNAFFGVMLIQPLLALAPAWIAIASPAPAMACLTVLTGAVVMVASMLYLDR